jgi:hypothetical protein
MVAVADTLGPSLERGLSVLQAAQTRSAFEQVLDTAGVPLVRLHLQAFRLCSYADCYGLLRTSTWLCSVGLQHKLSHRCDGLERGLWGLVWLGTNQVMSDPSGGMTLVAVGVSPLRFCLVMLQAAQPSACQARALLTNVSAELACNKPHLCRTPKKLSAVMC